MINMDYWMLCKLNDTLVIIKQMQPVIVVLGHRLTKTGRASRDMHARIEKASFFSTKYPESNIIYSFSGGYLLIKND